MRIKYRKAQPSPPRYFWWDTDSCHFCKNRNNCRNCSYIKKYIKLKDNSRHERQKEKRILRKYQEQPDD